MNQFSHRKRNSAYICLSKYLAEIDKVIEIEADDCPCLGEERMWRCHSVCNNILLVRFMSSVVLYQANASWYCYALQLLLEGHISCQKFLLPVIFFRGKERKVQHLPSYADALISMHQGEPS